MTEAIHIDNVSFTYRRPSTAVFQDFTLHFRQNETVCILGHNGAGKTTLLKLVFGILRPQLGAVRINSAAIGTYDDIFILTERFGISKELSLRENLAFQCKLRGRDHGHILTDPRLREFGLHKHIDKPTGKLSAGHFMRANLIAGLAFDPSLIMLDEPTNSVDPATRSLLLARLSDAQRDGATIVIVTHDLGFAHALGNRLVVIDDGRVVIDEPRARGTTADEFQSRYLRFTREGG